MVMASRKILRSHANAMKAQLWTVRVLSVLAMVLASWPIELRSAPSMQVPTNSTPYQPPKPDETKQPKRLRRDNRPILAQLSNEDLYVEVLGGDSPGLRV